MEKKKYVTNQTDQEELTPAVKGDSFLQIKREKKIFTLELLKNPILEVQSESIS